MAARVVISAPQNRVRDCYASAPNIDLTLRSNGEEKVQLMDSYGQFTQAGFDPPTVAPTLALGAAGGIANGWIGYIYAYAAKYRYPLVDAGTSAGGSIAPRSNPSPSGNIQMVGGPKHILVTCATSPRQDISHIWVYRTLTFSTQQEAIDSANAGTAFYIGEIINDPNVPTVVFDDSTTVGGGGEQCDTDNFTAPQFRYCVYLDPYFWGFGNPALTLPCTVAADGSFAMIPSDATKLFSGREGQVISFQGIDSGGFDGHGNYYFKQTNDYGGRSMDDPALTVFGTLEFTGDTYITFHGQSNILYRSKPHNPLSWGETEVIANIRIPHLYAFRVGGGNGTAIAIIANLNLLKLDTEGPSISYVLNLRLAGTPAFEESKREMSRGYSVANHFTQISSQVGNNIVLWGYDFKSFAILQCDGSSQVPVSSKVYDTLRVLVDSKFNHAIYDDRTELAAFWFSTGIVGGVNDFVVLYHVPTGNWSTHLDFDVSCSATIWDSVAGINKTIVGTSTGLVGTAFTKGSASNWVFNAQFYIALATNPGADMTLQATGVAPFNTATPWLWVGNYVIVCQQDFNPPHNYTLEPIICKIIAIPTNIAMDLKVYSGVFNVTSPKFFGFVGASPKEIQKFTQLSSPVTQKQLTEMWLTIEGLYNLRTQGGAPEYTFDPALELTLVDRFSYSLFGGATKVHFTFAEVSGNSYNKELNKYISFSDIVGFRLQMYSPNGLIQISDISMSFENA